MPSAFQMRFNIVSGAPSSTRTCCLDIIIWEIEIGGRGGNRGRGRGGGLRHKLMSDERVQIGSYRPSA